MDAVLLVRTSESVVTATSSECRTAAAVTTWTMPTSTAARAGVAPASRTSQSTISACRSPMIRVARSETAARSPGGVADHSRCASRAAR